MGWKALAASVICAWAGMAWADDFTFTPAMPVANPTEPAAEITPLPQIIDEGWVAPEERIVVAPVVCPEPKPQAWYARLDYFHWEEQVDSRDFVNESGMLTTLGYQYRRGRLRWRAEMFGGVMDYEGYVESGHVREVLHDANGTTYLGCRGEWEFLVEPKFFPNATLVAGIGTRLWVRGLEDTTTPMGITYRGYQETWWTWYPYVGVESRESNEPGPHLFGSVRFGITPWTYEHASLGVTLHPECGIASQAELGLRGQRFSLSAYLEALTWAESRVHAGYCQPESAMLTLGARLLHRY